MSLTKKKSLVAAADSNDAIVRGIRDKENLIISDVKNTNLLLDLKANLSAVDATGKPIASEVRVAALHANRRIFVNYLENGKLSKSKTEKSEKKEEYRSWLLGQFHSFQDTLLAFISSGDPVLQAPATRTLLQLVRREYLLQVPWTKDHGPSATFGVKSFRALIEALLQSIELPAEILLMLRDEVFIKPDCAYYTLYFMTQILTDFKASLKKLKLSADKLSDEQVEEDARIRVGIQNCLDMIRMIALPEKDEPISKDDFLVTGKGVLAEEADDSSDELPPEEDAMSDDNADEFEYDERTKYKVARKNGRSLNDKDTSNKKKKSRQMSRSEKLVDWESHRRVYSKAWLSVLSMPLTKNQHKIALKHLPEFVINFLDEPLVVSDYLTRSYESGGVVSVLALESLFQLIVKYNLDFPNFFTSLYNLCSTEVFSARYRSKFIKLLSASLKSTNLPSYVVSAFIKRLAYLSLHAPVPCSLYCVSQIMWLLKKHPQCLKMIHRLSKEDKVEYDINESSQLERSNALESSLWEMTVLQSSVLNSVINLATTLEESPASTKEGKGSMLIVVEDFVDSTYADLMESELKKIKKNAAMAFRNVNELFSGDTVIKNVFNCSGKKA